jgi:hypothetical protein
VEHCEVRLLKFDGVTSEATFESRQWVVPPREVETFLHLPGESDRRKVRQFMNYPIMPPLIYVVRVGDAEFESPEPTDHACLSATLVSA